MAAAPSPVKYKHGARGATDESSVISLLGLENAALAPQLEGCPATVHVACRRAARWGAGFVGVSQRPSAIARRVAVARRCHSRQKTAEAPLITSHPQFIKCEGELGSRDGFNPPDPLYNLLTYCSRGRGYTATAQVCVICEVLIRAD